VAYTFEMQETIVTKEQIIREWLQEQLAAIEEAASFWKDRLDRFGKPHNKCEWDITIIVVAGPGYGTDGGYQLRQCSLCGSYGLFSYRGKFKTLLTEEDAKKYKR